jgi:two-component system, chemotaxis family, CheB/CheR fusion protein
MSIRLPDSEELLRVLVQDATDYAFIILDRTGSIERWNRGAEVLFGYPAETVLSRHFSFLFTAEDVGDGVPDAELQQAVDNGKAIDRRWHARRDGTRFFADGVTTALFTGEDLIGFAKLARDVTALKAAEEDRQRLLVREQQVNRAKDDFFAAVSHELRTPLTTMKGWLELIHRNPDDKQVVDDGLATLDQATSTLAKLVDDLLDAARSRTGKMRVDPQPSDLGAVVTEALNAFRLALEAKQITLRADIAEGLLVRADTTRLHQVIWNVIANAIRHNPPGGAIDVALRRDDGAAILDVRDTGDGIDPALLPQIFEPFRQHSHVRGGGLGLGLAIARSLVEIHGGTITAESEGVGTGATFRIRLPLLEPAPERA